MLKTVSAIINAIGAVEILRFSAGMYFSGVAAVASTVYMTPGEGL